jgi:predicted nucleic acid-binding Zn ribbon protein
MAKGNCKQCGAVTETRGKTLVKHFCNSVCNQKYKREEKRQEELKRLGDRRCTVCDADINHTKLGTRFCSKRCTQSKPKEHKFCKHCNSDMGLVNSTTVFCSRKCQQSFNNEKKKVVQKEKRCLECKEMFMPEVRTKQFCSKSCRDKFHYKNRLRSGNKREDRTCEAPDCTVTFNIPKGGRKKTCSDECRKIVNTIKQRERVRPTINIDRICVQCNTPFIAHNIKTVTCSYSCNGKLGAKKRGHTLKEDRAVIPKPKKTTTKKKLVVKTIKEKVTVKSKPKVVPQPKKIEVPMFKAESMPKVTPKESLSMVIVRRTKQKTQMTSKAVDLQQEWLKKNKATVIEPTDYKYKAYQGNIEPTNTLTEYGKFTGMKGNVESLDDSRRDVGID